MKKYISVLVSVALLVLICVLVARFGFVEQESPVEQTTQTKEPLTDPVLILSSENSVEWNSEEYCVDAEAQLNAYLYYFSANIITATIKIFSCNLQIWLKRSFTSYKTLHHHKFKLLELAELGFGLSL